jgi:hypothetical protein
MALVFSTDNARLAMNRMGLCNGMSAVWARHSLVNNGCTAAHKSQIEDGALILTTRMRLTPRSTGAAADVWVSAMQAASVTATLAVGQTFADIAALALHLTTAYCGQTVYFVANVRNGAGLMENHAMGARITSNVCDFFEPNQGLDRHDTQAAFRTAVAARLTALAANVTGSSVFIWTVTT